ncbi:MAG: hypothetical protein QW520_04270 [Methanomassiliicoccales archaeon]
MVSLIDFVFGRMISLVIFGLVLTSLLVVLRLKARASCNEDRRDETVSGPYLLREEDMESTATKLFFRYLDDAMLGSKPIRPGICPCEENYASISMTQC